MLAQLDETLDTFSDPMSEIDTELLITLGTSAAIIVLCAFVHLWFRGTMAVLARTGRLSEMTSLLLARLSRWTMTGVALLLLLQQYGWMENAWTTLTAILAMVAIGFVAVWSVLSNTLCSIILMVIRPFNVGDTIELPNASLAGKVIDFNLIYTTLRDESDDSLLQVPNNLFFQQPIRRTKGKRTVPLNQQADRDEPHDE